jgi:urate oxidase
MIELAENRYGKSHVRLMKVTRGDEGHNLREWTVEVLLKGNFESAHVDGDNSKILPTDTMKNTIYSLARSSRATSMEDYAKELADFLLGRNPQVDSASVRVESTLWKRLNIDGKPHPSAFMRGSNERQNTTVEREQNGPFHITSGLDDLVILKSANSAFAGYIKDSLTTLPETSDRIFATALRAQWRYGSATHDFDDVRHTIREAMLHTFAWHDSKSVQHTLYAMANSALKVAAEIDEIEIAMPNKHCLLVDLSRFGQDNPNEIFVPTDEPYGYIEARVRRTSSTQTNK